MIRAEHYISAFPERKLTDHGPDDVQAYLQKIGRKGGLKDWQHVQIVDARQNLLQLIEVDWLAQVDWEFWRNSSRSLSPKHPTIARDSAAVSRDRIVRESSDNDVALARSQHSVIMTRLVNEIRRRGYSIRTEQAYEGWTARYIAFSGIQSPDQMGA